MSSIANTYAQAIKFCFPIGQEQDFIVFVQELQLLQESLYSSEVNSFFNSPIISVEKKKQVLGSCFDFFKCSKYLSSFLFLILDKKRWLELEAITLALIKIENKIKGIVLVEVESVKKIDLDLKQQILKKMSEFFNKNICLKENISSKNLIGGIKICSDGLIFDDTLLFHLTQMENQIRRDCYEDTSQ